MKAELFADPQEKELIIKTLDFARRSGKRIYLVGGVIRDNLIGRNKLNPDFDFCLQKGAIPFARKFKDELKAGFVILDSEHGACRLVKKIGAKIYTLDFTDFRGKDLEQDLLHRDFTINSLALDPQELFSHKSRPALDWQKLVIDPQGGRKDLKNKLLKIANNKAFDEDPLRIMRAFSLAAIFGFKIDKATLALIKSKKDKLSGVSYERIRDELFKVLRLPDSYKYLLMMDKLGVLKVIIPQIELMRKVSQGPYHHLDVWKHTLESLRQFEKLLQEIKGNTAINDYLNETLSFDRCRSSLIKLALILHDIGKPGAKRRKNKKITFYGHERAGYLISKDIIKYLKLSNDEYDALKKMILWHLRPGYLADHEMITPRAKFRYFRDTQKEALSVLLLSIADQRATKGRISLKKDRLHHEQVAFGLIKEYFKKSRENKPAPLINGDDLINKLKLKPSELFSKILAEIEELQAIGRIKTKQEALKRAKIISRMK